MAVLAVDLGGTSMRAALAAPEGSISRRHEVPTPRSPDPSPLIELMRGVAEGSGATTAVVGVPGRVDYGAGTLEWAPNLAPGWAEGLNEAALGAALGIEVSLANDADLAAVGEAAYGAGSPYADVAYVTVSTGVGAGVVTNGLLTHGRRSLAELGHCIIDLHALPDGPARVEHLGSGTAMKRRAAEAGLEGDGREVERLMRSGDATATSVWDAVVEAAAVGAVNLAWFFTPEVIVVGGGLGLRGEAVLGPIRDHVQRLGPVDLPDPIEVVNAALADDAALAGAAAWERAFNPEAAGRGR